MKDRNKSQRQQIKNNLKLEQKLVKDAIRKVQIRESNRNRWFKQQMKNSMCVNNMNEEYKKKHYIDGLPPHIARKESPDANRTGSVNTIENSPDRLSISKIFENGDNQIAKRKEKTLTLAFDNKNTIQLRS